MPEKSRILIIAHGHPDNSKGGGEVAAYNLHNKLNTTDNYHSVFLARHKRDELLHPGSLLSGTGRPNEVLLHSTRNNYFLHSQHNKVLVGREFRQTLERVNPDIIHFQHYVHLGLELIREARAFNPQVRIVLTLHEFIAICNNSGQMMTTGNNLCHESSPSACVNCFPQHPPQDFLMRKLFFKAHFDLVDTFISPSQFLKARYIDWGIPAEKINVIENLLDDSKYKVNPSQTIDTAATAECVRFSFYGQINWFKGLDVLLKAVEKLPKEIRDRTQLDINGTGLEEQPEQLRNQIQHLVDSMLDVVHMRGPYTQTDLCTLMHSSHWMIVPSKWWENSPMVILEARKHGLPVICSDIGGMAEKIEDKVTGLHFQVGRPDALARAITWAVENPDQQMQFAHEIKESYRDGEAFEQHSQLYKDLLASKTSVSQLSLSTIISDVKAENEMHSISNISSNAA